MEATQYVVIESTPGYAPDSDDPFVGSYAECVAVANELADALEAEGYDCDRSWASSGNYYAILCRRSDAMTRHGARFIQVEYLHNTAWIEGSES